jgi:hypothetical protein
VKAAGSQVAWCRKTGVSRENLNRVLRRRLSPTKSIINALGLRVVLLLLKSTPRASAKQLEAGLVGAEVPYAMIMEAGVIQKLGECLGLVILVVGVCPNFIES